MTDPSILDNEANYNTDYATNVITTLDQFNNVYVRGKNTSNAPLTSRVYFFQAFGDVILWPAQWDASTFTIATQPQHYLDVKSQANSLAHAGPILWKPSTANPHYCIVVWASNDNPAIPPAMDSFGSFKSMDDLGDFIMKHPNMAWRNTNDVRDSNKFKTSQYNLTGARQVDKCLLESIYLTCPSAMALQCD